MTQIHRTGSRLCERWSSRLQRSILTLSDKKIMLISVDLHRLHQPLHQLGKT